MIHLKTILQPTDFSEDAKYALEVACALARDQAARVLLLHVVPRPAPIGHDVGTPALKEAHAAEDLQGYRREVLERLEQLRNGAASARVEVLLREGDVPGTIVRTAEENSCDLIVMGSHGRSRIYQAMMGSVSAEVTRKTPCPAVILRMPPSAK